MMPSLAIHCGDSAQVLSELPTDCIDLVVTSPPYDEARFYGGTKTPEWDFQAIASELYRVLVPGGVLCWNVNDMVVKGSETLTSCKQKIFFVEQCGFRCHDTMIYERLNFSAPESVRYHQALEYIFILSKGAPRCFNPIMDRKNVYGGQQAWGKNSKRQTDGSLKQKDKTTYAEYGMRTNIWRGKTRGQEEPCQEQKHPAPMPKWLARDLILSWSNPGDTVLDPFGGSGTTGQMAQEHGRHAILIDRNPDYVALSKETCRAKTPGLALAVFILAFQFFSVSAFSP